MIKLLITLLRWLGVDVLAERKRALREYTSLVRDFEELMTRTVPEEVIRVAETLLPLVERFEDVPQSGAWKRKEVYALGIKAFPSLPKNIIAYALEYAIWKDS